MQEEWKRGFEQYVKEFDMKDAQIRHKFHHSYRVLENIQKIAEELSLSEEMTKLACIVGLYHDIGRFSQWRDYHTFHDGESFDHGEFGSKLFLEKNFVPTLSSLEKEMVATAIAYHNQLTVSSINEEQDLLISMIRDADCLDIVREQACFNHDKEIILNPDLVKAIYEKRRGSNKILKTDTDFILHQLSWILLFQFDYAYAYLEKYDIVRKKLDLLSLYGETEEIKKLKQMIEDEVKKHVREKV